MEFTLSSPAGGELEIIMDAPAEVLPYRPPAFKTDMVKGRFGSMYFNHFKGQGFDIWYSNYQILHSTTIKGRADRPVLELHNAVTNNFQSWWDGIGVPAKKEKQYNMSFTPHVHNKAELIGGFNYETCDFHFSVELLQDYSPFYPTLDKFLNKIQKQYPCSLLLEDSFLSSKMSACISDLLTNNNHPGVAWSFYSAKVTDFLIMMLERDALTNSQLITPFKNREKDFAHAARDFLISDFSKYPSIKRIAHEVGTNTCTLQKAFKFYFGETIYDYFHTARLDKAKELLLDLQYSIQEVSEMVGYPDKQNLYAAFKKRFGITPGQWCKENNKNRN